jgi:hypothetical protein
MNRATNAGSHFQRWQAGEDYFKKWGIIMETREIWKYVIYPRKLNHMVPRNGIIRYVSEQHGEICVWIEVNPNEAKEWRHFEIYGTGHPIIYKGDNPQYIGSVKVDGGNFIFHVYEGII